MTQREQRAEQIGRECWQSMIEACGSDPRDCDGSSLLPSEPQAGDWQYLQDQLGETSAEERAAFRRAYRA